MNRRVSGTIQFDGVYSGIVNSVSSNMYSGQANDGSNTEHRSLIGDNPEDIELMIQALDSDLTPVPIDIDQIADTEEFLKYILPLHNTPAN